MNACIISTTTKPNYFSIGDNEDLEHFKQPTVRLEEWNIVSPTKVCDNEELVDLSDFTFLEYYPRVDLSDFQLTLLWKGNHLIRFTIKESIIQYKSTWNLIQNEYGEIIVSPQLSADDMSPQSFVGVLLRFDYHNEEADVVQKMCLPIWYVYECYRTYIKSMNAITMSFITTHIVDGDVYLAHLDVVDKSLLKTDNGENLVLLSAPRGSQYYYIPFSACIKTKSGIEKIWTFECIRTRDMESIFYITVRYRNELQFYTTTHLDFLKCDEVFDKINPATSVYGQMFDDNMLYKFVSNGSSRIFNNGTTCKYHNSLSDFHKNIKCLYGTQSSLLVPKGVKNNTYVISLRNDDLMINKSFLYTEPLRRSVSSFEGRNKDL